MKLRFANAFNEYSAGPFHVVNDGKAFDALGSLATDLLKAKGHLNGEDVNVFELAGPEEAEASASTQEEPPIDTPLADAAAGTPSGGTHSASGETTTEEPAADDEPKKRRK